MKKIGGCACSRMYFMYTLYNIINLVHMKEIQNNLVL